MTVYEQSRESWCNLSELRRKRQRLKKFTYGRQWDDIVKDPETGEYVTERSLISRDSRPPLCNNLIRQLVKTVIGRYRLKVSEDRENCDDEKLAKLYAEEQLAELDSRLLEEYLISGIAVQRVGYGTNTGKTVKEQVENIAVDRLFMSLPKDPRCNDVELIGTLRDYTPEEVAMRWGGNNRNDVIQMLKRLREESNLRYLPSKGEIHEVSDFEVAEDGKVRVIEAWRREWCDEWLVHDPKEACVYKVEGNKEESLKRENSRRRRHKEPELRIQWNPSMRWTCRWYLGDGTLLESAVLEEEDRCPFVVKLYPLIDGEVHSLVEDVVDQQKYVNRLINLLDRMMATAAKGALLFPVEALPEGCAFEDVTRQWSATDGVVLYRSMPNRPEPRQLSTTVGDIGAKDLLKTEMQLFKEISGVGDALRGTSLPAGVGAERYGMELENASIAIKDILDSFCSLIEQRNKLILKSNSKK